MQRLARIRGWRISEAQGEPITAFGRQIIPVGRVFQLNWPGGAFVRHRPVAIEVRQGDVVHRLPIHHVTLRAITAIVLTGLAVAVVASLLMRWVHSRRRRTS
jgi:hypothetical protein